MEPRSNYFIVGLFVIGLVAVTIISVLWLSANRHKTVSRIYATYVNESVSGLSVQAPVKFNGVNVGFVKAMALNPKNSQQVRLLLSIEESTPINQSTRATLMAQGITGIMFVGLTAGAATAPPLEVGPGDEYPIIPSEPSVLVELGAVLRKMTDDMSGISRGFQELLNEKNQKAIHDSLQNLNVVLQNSQGTLGNFTQQVMPSFVNTLDQFDQVLNHAGPLVSTLQDNPSALIRGKSPGTPGPGE